jgi:CoA:oxalate CoA-transferase
MSRIRSSVDLPLVHVFVEQAVKEPAQPFALRVVVDSAMPVLLEVEFRYLKRRPCPAHAPRNYLAAAGVVGMAMKDDGVPSFGVPVADLAGATYALAALQAALLQRAHTGRGQHLDVSLTDCAAHWMNPRLAALHEAGGDADRVRRQVQQRPAYGVFRCRDGEFISVAALEDHFWRALVRALPLPSFDARARYGDRLPQAEAINEAIALALLKEDVASALDRLAAADVPVAEVVGLAQVARSETWATRRLFVETEVGRLARFPVVLEGMARA